LYKLIRYCIAKKHVIEKMRAETTFLLRNIAF